MSINNVVREVTLNDLPRLVLMPPDNDVNPSEAIPADIFPILEEVFDGCSPTFLKNLWLQLWAREMRTISDFSKPQAMTLLSQAIKLAVRHDGLSVILKIKEHQNGHG